MAKLDRVQGIGGGGGEKAKGDIKKREREARE